MNRRTNSQQISEENPISTRLSRPQEPPSNQSTSRQTLTMDKSKAKMPKHEDDQFDDNESTHSLDNEFGDFDVPPMRSPGVKKALKMANRKLLCST